VSGPRKPGLSEAARRILCSFLERYPSSAQKRGGRKLRLAKWDNRLPAISRDLEGKERFLDAVEELEKLGVLSVRWGRFRVGEEVEALYLEDPALLYALLGEKSPRERREELLDVLKRRPWSDGPLSTIASTLAARLEEDSAVGVEKPDELRDIGRLLLLTPEQCADAALRALSVRLFNNSKRLEHLLRGADRLCAEIGREPLSEAIGLRRSFPEVSVALFGSLFVAGRRWRCDGEVLSLPLETVLCLSGVELDPRSWSTAWVLGVENKESFYTAAAAARRSRQRGSQKHEPSAVVYTAGHPNQAVTGMVSLLARADTSLMHFGDLDPEGLLILQELERAAGRPMQPFMMDIKTYLKYLPHGRPLSQASLRRLSEVTHEALRPLATEIAGKGIGVEQEVITVSFG